jgi:predicted transcriptional regulator
VQALTDEQHRFIEDLGRYMAQYGMSPTLGRIWGYLLLSPQPVSLDRIADDLQISKSSASVAARQLEAFQMARRSGQRGSRRVVYEASDFSNQRLLDWALASYRTLAQLLGAGARASTDDVARARLEGSSDFFASWTKQLDGHLRRWRDERRKA